MSEGKCTSWLGHRFEARYTSTPPDDGLRLGEGSAYAMKVVIEALTKREYHGDICVRCGQWREPPAD